MSTDYLFTYGLLKRKHHKLLPFSLATTFFGEAYTTGSLYQIADYPGIKLTGNSKVFGEIHSVNKNFNWLQMDEFEHASPTIKVKPEYRRIRTICFIGMKEYECWIYEYLGHVAKSNLINNGVF